MLALQSACLRRGTFAASVNVSPSPVSSVRWRTYPETSGAQSTPWPRQSSSSLDQAPLSEKLSGGAHDFSICFAVNPVADDLDNEIRRFHARRSRRAFLRLLSPLFDPDLARFPRNLACNPTIPG